MPDKAPVVSAEPTTKDYRKEYTEKWKRFFKQETLPILRDQFVKSVDVIVKPRSVNMKKFKVDENEMQRAILLYANDSR
jgi:hypothetical protein